MKPHLRRVMLLLDRVLDDGYGYRARPALKDRRQQRGLRQRRHATMHNSANVATWAHPVFQKLKDAAPGAQADVVRNVCRAQERAVSRKERAPRLSRYHAAGPRPASLVLYSHELAGRDRHANYAVDRHVTALQKAATLKLATSMQPPYAPPSKAHAQSQAVGVPAPNDR